MYPYVNIEIDGKCLNITRLSRTVLNLAIYTNFMQRCGSIIRLLVTRKSPTALTFRGYLSRKIKDIDNEIIKISRHQSNEAPRYARSDGNRGNQSSRESINELQPARISRINSAPYF